MSKEEEAVPVNFETTLIEPDGFYAKYSNIEPKARKLALVRIPSSISLEDLSQITQVSLSSSSKSSSTLATLIKEETNFDLIKCAQNVVPASVLVPGKKGLTIAKIDKMWRLQRRVENEAESVGNEVDWDGDVGIGAVGKAKRATVRREQPGGLRMNLSAVDVDTIIAQKRPRNNDADASTSSPTKKRSKNK